jgi:hypothetical protein
MRFTDRRIVSWLAVVACSAGVLFAFGASISAAAPPSRAEIEQIQREARKRHEEARRQVEEARQRRGRERRRTERTQPGSRAGIIQQKKASDRRMEVKKRLAQERESPVDDLKYRIEPGAAFAYYFVFRKQLGERADYLGGVAWFEREEDDREVCLIARDNIRGASSSKSLPITIPNRAMMLPEKIRPGSHGIEPGLDNNLPFQLGRAADWFFPPLPHRDRLGATRHEGTSANRMFADDPAYFEWRVTVVQRTKVTAKLEESRSFHTKDGWIDMKATGTIHFDTRLGIMVRREVKGTYREQQRVTPFSLTIVHLDRNSLQKLLASQ